MNVEPNIFEKLCDQYRAHKLALFVGAGVSMSCGLPDWKTLSHQVVDESIPVDPRIGQPGHVTRPTEHYRRLYLKDMPLLEALRLVRASVGQEFPRVVQKALYQVPPATSEIVSKLASLTQCTRICNFNYDSLIQSAMAKAGRTCRTVIEGVPFSLLSEETVVFHPHGFLPLSDEIDGFPISRDVILSEDDYHRLSAYPFSWANLIQLSLLMNYTVLFVGFSLTDPNTRRLLDVVKESGSSHPHFAILKDPTVEIRAAEAYSWMPSSDVALSLFRQALTGRGVLPLWIDEFDEIPEVFDRLISSASTLATNA